MNTFVSKKTISIAEHGESLNLDINHAKKTVHIWITLPDGGQSIAVVKFTEYGIQVEQ